MEKARKYPAAISFVFMRCVDSISTLETTGYMRNMLLRDSDWAGMPPFHGNPGPFGGPGADKGLGASHTTIPAAG